MGFINRQQRSPTGKSLRGCAALLSAVLWQLFVKSFLPSRRAGVSEKRFQELCDYNHIIIKKNVISIDSDAAEPYNGFHERLIAEGGMRKWND